MNELNKCIMDIGQIFENNSDCYADTWQENNDTTPPTMVEGDVVMAMTKDTFIKVITELVLPDISGVKQNVIDLYETTKMVGETINYTQNKINI